MRSECREMPGQRIIWCLQLAEERVHRTVDRIPIARGFTRSSEDRAHALNFPEINRVAGVIVRGELDVVCVEWILKAAFGDTNRRTRLQRVTNAELKERIDVKRSRDPQ
jgi:hypothetical protein